MVELDLYYFYWLSMALQPLHHVPENVPLSAVSGHMAIARLALESFSGPAKRVLPETNQRVDELLSVINRILPERIPGEAVQNRFLSGQDVSGLDRAVDDLARALHLESKHQYVLCVEDQRCLSAYTLVEKIESCFSEYAWDLIDKTAKREFEESGKCLSLERYTGAGFHALRGIECVIRQYIAEATGSIPKKRDWGSYIDVLRNLGADGNLIAVLDNIRTLDRNPLMHPEDWLNLDDAIGIFNISHTAVARLAAGIAALHKSKGAAAP